MKRTKSLLSLLLMLSLLLSCLPLNAYATTDDADTSEEPPLSETTEPDIPVEVENLEELSAAIAAAEDGDTIAVCSPIYISENCVVGDAEKKITIVPTKDFIDGTLLTINSFFEQDIIIQNLILDGNGNGISALSVNSMFSTENTGIITVSNVDIENFISTLSTVSIYGITAVFSECYMKDNISNRAAGIEIAATAKTEIRDCLFQNNASDGNGGALLCYGQAKIENTEISDNEAGYTGNTACIGGGIYIDNTASCEIKNCIIVGNTATLGGGIGVSGSLTATDILLYRNNGKNAADDIYAPQSVSFSLAYTADMKSVYTENAPVGFYADYYGAPFDPVSNAVFLGETLTYEKTDNFFGAKFIFANDLPAPEETDPDTPPVDTPEEPDTPETPTEPEEPDTPDAPTEPEASDEPDVDPAPAPSKPTYPVRPIRPYVPPVEQETEKEDKPEETPPLELSHGGATLDTSTPLVLLGYGDGQPHENDPITRAQIAVLLFRSLTDESKAHLSGSTNSFADVTADAWYYDGVNALSAAGIINGYNGRFSPNDPLTWGQLIALLTRFVEAQTADVPEATYTAHWAYNNIVTAVAYGWIDNAASIDPDRPVTRGEAIEFVNSIFESCVHH